MPSIRRIEASNFAEARRIANALARRADTRATALNLVGHFRLRPGDRIDDQQGGPSTAADNHAERGAGPEPLDGAARREICLLALRGLRLSETPALRRLGQSVLDNALWFWTADAMAGGEYVRDKVKRDLTALPHTIAAASVSKASELRHEHSVPRKVVRAHFRSLRDRWRDVAEDDAVEVISSVLDQCPPVLVTKDEDKKLSGALRAGMGDGGSFPEDPFLRYVRAGIVTSAADLIVPEHGLWTREGRYRSSAKRG
jgi:hypothetical protein